MRFNFSVLVVAGSALLPALGVPFAVPGSAVAASPLWSNPAANLLIGSWHGGTASNPYDLEIKYAIEFGADGSYRYGARQVSRWHPLWHFEQSGRYTFASARLGDWDFAVDLVPADDSALAPADARPALVHFLGLPDGQRTHVYLKQSPAPSRMYLWLGANGRDRDQPPVLELHRKAASR